jgi:hypothetical protein
VTDAADGTLICVTDAVRTVVPAPVVGTFGEVIAACWAGVGGAGAEGAWPGAMVVTWPAVMVTVCKRPATMTWMTAVPSVHMNEVVPVAGLKMA